MARNASRRHNTMGRLLTQLADAEAKIILLQREATQEHVEAAASAVDQALEIAAKHNRDPSGVLRMIIWATLEAQKIPTKTDTPVNTEVEDE